MQHPFAPFLDKDDAYHELFGPLSRCVHAVRLPQKEIFDTKILVHAELVAWLRENASGAWFRIEDTRRNSGSPVHRNYWRVNPGKEYDIGSLFYFENETDAVFFKLRWYDSERL